MRSARAERCRRLGWACISSWSRADRRCRPNRCPIWSTTMGSSVPTWCCRAALRLQPARAAPACRRDRGAVRCVRRDRVAARSCQRAQAFPRSSGDRPAGRSKRHGMRAARRRSTARDHRRDRTRACATGRRGWRSLSPSACARRRVRAGIAVPDQRVRARRSGGMDERRYVGAVRGVSGGLSEIYIHPAVRDDWPGHAPGYRYAPNWRR